MSLNDINVLLVDDDPIFLKVTSDYLMACGASVEQANTAKLALQFFNSVKFDIVLASLNMPSMKGTEMLDQFTVSENAIPFVVISNNQKVELALKALKAGASDYLVKPIKDLKQIENAIAESLNL